MKHAYAPTQPVGVPLTSYPAGFHAPFDTVLGSVRREGAGLSDGARNQAVGLAFERVVAHGLRNGALGAQVDVRTVWLWEEFPDRFAVSESGRDIGIDIVVKCGNGNLIGVQSKWVSDDRTLTYEDLSTFLATGMHYANGEHFFSSLLLVSTVGVNSTARHRMESMPIPVSSLIASTGNSVMEEDGFAASVVWPSHWQFCHWDAPAMHLSVNGRQRTWFAHLATRITDWETNGPRPVGSRDVDAYPNDPQFPKWWHHQLGNLRNGSTRGNRSSSAEERALLTYVGLEVTPSTKPNDRVSQTEHMLTIERSGLYYDEPVTRGMTAYPAFYAIRDMYRKGKLLPEVRARLDRQHFLWAGTRGLAEHEWQDICGSLANTIGEFGDPNTVPPDYVDPSGFCLGAAITRLKWLSLRHQLGFEQFSHCRDIGLSLAPPEGARWLPADKVPEGLGGGRPTKRRIHTGSDMGDPVEFRGDAA